MDLSGNTDMATRRAAREKAFLPALTVDEKLLKLIPAAPANVVHVLVYCDGVGFADDVVARAATLLGMEPCGRAIASLMGWPARPQSADIVATGASVAVKGTQFAINDIGEGKTHVILLGLDFFLAVAHVGERDA